jgi:spore germination protein GerM
LITQRGPIVGGGIVLAVVLGWLLFVALPKWYRPPSTKAATAQGPKTAPAPGRKIKARLFYVGDDGSRLVGVEQEVPFGEGTVEQARQIIEAQIAPPSERLVSAVPAETKLRAIFVTERGEAFIDLSREVVAGHTGGSTNEVLTVYALVNALTANLPAVTSVQVLVDGKQVDTLAGHIDLRRPIEKNLEWVQ